MEAAEAGGEERLKRSREDGVAEQGSPQGAAAPAVNGISKEVEGITAEKVLDVEPILKKAKVDGAEAAIADLAVTADVPVSDAGPVADAAADALTEAAVMEAADAVAAATTVEITDEKSGLKDAPVGVDEKDGNNKVPEEVKLGPMVFRSGVDIFTYFYELLHGWVMDHDFNKYEHMVLLDLISKGHSEPATKIGAGISAFQVRNHPQWHSRCYYLKRTDGSYEDFSYRKCVDKLMPLPPEVYSASGALNLDFLVNKQKRGGYVGHGKGGAGRGFRGGRGGRHGGRGGGGGRGRGRR